MDQLGELSTIDSYSNADDMAHFRKKHSKKYNVETITLNDLLEKYNIKIITCEHNYSVRREKIFSLLSSKGYKRKYSEFSRYDD